MNILIVSDSYPPEIRSASHLMQELAEELGDRGHAVTVATCYPKYNLVENTSSPHFKEFSLEDGIKIIRIKTLSHHKVNFIVRGLSQLLMPYIFWAKLRRYLIDRMDAVIVYSPPLPLWRIGFQTKKISGARFILNIQDIFPQNAIDLGVLQNTTLIKFFERMEAQAYQQADIITVHSEGNREFLMNHKGVPESKVRTLYNWIDLNAFSAVKSNGYFRKQYGFENKFVFLFAGVMGPSQNLDLIVNIATQVQSFSDLVFLFVGDGSEKEQLVKMVQQRSLKNVFFKPFVSKKQYPALVKEVDVGLVCLSSKNKTPVVPGKILGYMAAGIPVLALLNKESGGHALIKDANCGYSTLSDNTEEGVALVLKLRFKRNDLKILGENGYKYAAECFSKDKCVDRLEELLKQGA
jgi:glycosyltransferase involved in cell wall biosynthesis